ncbi:hypothetical protein [Spirosoma areae]
MKRSYKSIGVYLQKGTAQAALKNHGPAPLSGQRLYWPLRRAAGAVMTWLRSVATVAIQL